MHPPQRCTSRARGSRHGNPSPMASSVISTSGSPPIQNLTRRSVLGCPSPDWAPAAKNLSTHSEYVAGLNNDESVEMVEVEREPFQSAFGNESRRSAGSSKSPRSPVGARIHSMLIRDGALVPQWTPTHRRHVNSTVSATI